MPSFPLSRDRQGNRPYNRKIAEQDYPALVLSLIFTDLIGCHQTAHEISNKWYLAMCEVLTLVI